MKTCTTILIRESYLIHRHAEFVGEVSHCDQTTAHEEELKSSGVEVDLTSSSIPQIRG